jgi:hypothetical protein
MLAIRGPCKVTPEAKTIFPNLNEKEATMKRSLTAVLFAMFAATAIASNSQYNNEAGEQDFATPIASSDQYRNEAGEQDVHTPVADAGSIGNQEQSYPQVG